MARVVQKETRRLLEVLDTRLADNDHLAGVYSIADIANFAWARTANWSGVESRDLEHLSRWIEAIRALWFEDSRVGEQRNPDGSARVLIRSPERKPGDRIVIMVASQGGGKIIEPILGHNS